MSPPHHHCSRLERDPQKDVTTSRRKLFFRTDRSARVLFGASTSRGRLVRPAVLAVEAALMLPAVMTVLVLVVRDAMTWIVMLGVKG